jgi:hypothetical protein
VIGAGVLAILDERLSTSLELREVLYGIFVIAIFLGFKRGLVPAFAGLFDRFVVRRRSKSTLQPSRE